MTTDHNCPCELILKIGCNEYDEISTAIASLVRSCTITDQTFLGIERQIQPTTYYGSFTNHSSNSNIPIQCQSLSCLIFLTDEIFKKLDKKDFFKSTHTWNFHHKIELLDEYKQIIARQDYYELSNLLPLWSISHIPYSRKIIVRFNIFTRKFDLMLKFYKNLLQRKPDSSKTGFVVFNLTSPINNKLSYQFSIKYSPSIQSYTISQGAYLKFRLTNLNYFIHEYTSKLFTINKYEYYIYDPDGNLLHLYLYNTSSNTKDGLITKPSIQTHDSGFGGDSSDPSAQLFNPVASRVLSTNNDIDGRTFSSTDSAQCSSISSNDVHTKTLANHHNNLISKNNISVRSANKNEVNFRLKQRQRTGENQWPSNTTFLFIKNMNKAVFFLLKRNIKFLCFIVFSSVSRRPQQTKPSLYESEPRLANFITVNNRYYSSMNNIQTPNNIRSFRNNNFKSTVLTNASINENDTSYDVDSPLMQQKSGKKSPIEGYLNAFLLKKQQQQAQKSKEMIVQSEQSNIVSLRPRSRSTPLADPSLFSPSKSVNITSEQPTHSVANKSSHPFSKSATYEWENSNTCTQNTGGQDSNMSANENETQRINIGITLDSRLRKTPVLDMLRSTAMQSDIIEPTTFNRTNSLRHGIVPTARF